MPEKAMATVIGSTRRRRHEPFTMLPGASIDPAKLGHAAAEVPVHHVQVAIAVPPRRVRGEEQAVLPLGLVDVKVAAIDADWSGLKIVWRKERRTPS